jgi:thioredoxin-related protein
MIRALLAFFLLLVFGTVAAETRDVNQYFFDQKMGDFQAELAVAKKAGKQGILLMFEQEDCPFCHRMEQTILNQSAVQDYFRQHFLIFTIDIKSDNPMVDFKGKATTEKTYSALQRVRATPVFAFFDLHGNPTTRFTGAAKDVNEFLSLGRYVVEGAYQDKSLPFARYKLKRAAP